MPKNNRPVEELLVERALTLPGVRRDRLGGLTLDSTPPDSGFLETLEKWLRDGPGKGNKCHPDVGLYWPTTNADAKLLVSCGEWASGSLPQSNYTGRGLDGFVEFARRGWHEAEEMLRSASDIVAKAYPVDRSWKRVRKWADDGDEVSLDRARARDWDTDGCYESSARADGTSGLRGLTIAVNHSASGGAKPEALVWRALVAGTLAETLEAAGLPVRVLAYDLGGSTYACPEYGLVEPRINEQIVLVAKPYGARVDWSTLAIATGHPATLRVGFFAGMLASHDIKTVSYGFVVQGSPLIHDGSACVVVDQIAKSRESAERVYAATVGHINEHGLPPRPLVVYRGGDDLFAQHLLTGLEPDTTATVVA